MMRQGLCHLVRVRITDQALHNWLVLGGAALLEQLFQARPGKRTIRT